MLCAPGPEDLLQCGVQVQHELLQLLSLRLDLVLGRQCERYCHDRREQTPHSHQSSKSSRDKSSSGGGPCDHDNSESTSEAPVGWVLRRVTFHRAPLVCPPRHVHPHQQITVQQRLKKRKPRSVRDHAVSQFSPVSHNHGFFSLFFFLSPSVYSLCAGSRLSVGLRIKIHV